MSIPKECKRLAEVDFPLVMVSKYSRIEKEIKTGSFASIHIWWARRPLSACRAMNLACLLPDPSDSNCPTELRKIIATSLDKFDRQPSETQSRLGVEGVGWGSKDDGKLSEQRNKPYNLKKRLMKFIGEYANWNLRNNIHWTNCAREMVVGCNDGNPILLDPFAGGGSIPLEGIRIGAESYATDINPIPILLNRLQLEFIPYMSEKTLEKVEREVDNINQILKNELNKFYPVPDINKSNEEIIGYLCARTIQCEGVGCGLRYPLVSSPWVVNSDNHKICYTFSDSGHKEVAIGLKANPNKDEIPDRTVDDGNATCPICGHKTAVASVRRQIQNNEGGARYSKILAVISTPIVGSGRIFRLPTQEEIVARDNAALYLDKLLLKNPNLVPNDELPPKGSLGFRIQGYGMRYWKEIYTPRQLLTQIIIEREILKVKEKDIKLILALVASKFTNKNTSLSIWNPGKEKFLGCFAIHTVQMTWDFFEAYPYGNGGYNWKTTYLNIQRGIEAAKIPSGSPPGHALYADAKNHPMLDGYIDIWATDPPYYDSVPYSGISDYFIIWLKRIINDLNLENGLSPKKDEVVMDGSLTNSGEEKNEEWYDNNVEKVLREGIRVTKSTGIAYWVYAHKSTQGWSSVLRGIINAGWKVTGSWPISTERAMRLRAQRSAALETSIHIVMRPREKNAGIGDWADILGELPIRINNWLQRLTSEGIYGADAIFACIGPSMELFSKWDSVEKADGTRVLIDDFLKIVWDTVATEAIKIIDPSASNSNLEDDARFSMVVLWTLRQSRENPNGDTTDEGETSRKEQKPSSSDLPFDTASLLARGIGASIEKLVDQNVIVMSKKQNSKYVSLLSPFDRRHYLLNVTNGKMNNEATIEKSIQLKIGESIDSAQLRQKAENTHKNVVDIPKRDSTLDRLHQAMLLFADGNTNALDRLIKDVIGDNQTAWQLAQTLDTLYPEGSWERSKIEGVIDRYKSIFRKR